MNYGYIFGAFVPLIVAVGIYLYGDSKNIGWCVKLGAGLFLAYGAYLVAHWGQIVQTASSL
jgi:hypothetical protein